LTPEASTVLEQAASTYLRGGFRFVQIVGHTDTIGSPSYAQAISERRAFVAKDYLIARGVPPAMISARGAGQAELLVQTEDGVSEPQNRRTTIDLIT
jgi:OOP family OmpA-OmpF porin